MERQEYPKPTEKEEQLLKLIRELGFGRFISMWQMDNLCVLKKSKKA